VTLKGTHLIIEVAYIKRLSYETSEVNKNTFLDKIISLIILGFFSKKNPSSIDLSRANEKKIIFVITLQCQIIMADGFRVLIFLHAL